MKAFYEISDEMVKNVKKCKTITKKSIVFKNSLKYDELVM